MTTRLLSLTEGCLRLQGQHEVWRIVHRFTIHQPLAFNLLDGTADALAVVITEDPKAALARLLKKRDR